ncbi:MAG: NADP-reducing hydrogenase subunit HndC [Candidatus Hydrogenedentes bacterium ADurb.Bin101]|nr:MAG: NADP-reducing hydrogenase subunit HndC [Candidatus Hydrogenedentes bacterium ADurb.Bin101]HOC68319.1 NADH-quinone oxidoreductase subunit NuoE [Candidatus Hydrogenedentota bacterium]
MKTSLDITEVDHIIERSSRRPDALIPILQAIQEQFKYLPEEALRRVCETTDITPAAVESVATFFSQFRRKPVGKHIISVCDGTACHVKRSTAVFDAVAEQLHLKEGEDTDADGLFTVQKVACLGCCTLAPAVRIDSVTYGHVVPDTVSRMLEDFLEQQSRVSLQASGIGKEAPVFAGEIRIGLGSCCVAGGSEKIRGALMEALENLGISVRVKHVSCVGMCHQTPLLEIVLPDEPPHLYAKVQPEDVEAILAAHFRPAGARAQLRGMTSRWLRRAYTREEGDAPARYALDVRDAPVESFLGAQRRLATEYCGEMAPTDMEEYRRLSGFDALKSCLGLMPESGRALSPEAVIAEMETSQLRGRGGAGFPTALKWRAVKNAPGERKYIICNGDEGDPGAFMDRMILESYPLRVIEGMLIASLATGAREGILYIRAEYPLAISRVEEAIVLCEREGYLGTDILGSGHEFQVRVARGAGAFVCGEETALIASLEGRRGSPAFRPPFPAQQGLHGCPTLVNNTETFAMVPWILRHGGAAFAAIGTERSKGTKVFSLAGKVARGGLIEVPMGSTIRHIVDDIGGGVAGGRRLKAVQIGGPSGGCIPAALCDTPVDYEALLEAGAMMGSGGFVVLDDTDCMVEMAHYFLSFTQRESCGKCAPCRVGTKRMLELLGMLCRGEGKGGDLEQLEELAQVVKLQSLCGLGKTAPNPVLTTLRYFRDEFEAHIEGRCPAGKCKPLITYRITEDCIGCTKCAQVCAPGAIAANPYALHEINGDLCTKCDNCRVVCPVDAVKVE